VRAEKYNPDKAFDLVMMLARWGYVKTLAWEATHTVGQVILLLDVLSDLITTKIGSAPFERFNLTRFKKVIFQVEMIANRFTEGRLLVVFFPTQRAKAHVHPDLYSIRNAVQLGAISLDPSTATVAQLEIDFTYMRQYIDLVNGDSLGQIAFIVQNTFVPAVSGTNYTDVKCFFRLEESEFKQPRPGDETNFNQVLSNLRLVGEAHMMDDLIDAGAGEIKKLVAEILPKEVVSDALGGLLDNVIDGQQIAPVISKEIQYLNNAQNFYTLMY